MQPPPKNTVKGRIRIILITAKRKMSCQQIHDEIARLPEFRGTSYETVAGAIIEMGFEGYVKVDYEPVVELKADA